jgi:hypothetical protein
MSTVGPSDHLAQLEGESIDIMREVIAQCAKPVMLHLLCAAPPPQRPSDLSR